MSKNHFILAFIGILIILLAGNNLMPVTDNVESNYALTAKEMVLSGDWISLENTFLNTKKKLQR